MKFFLLVTILIAGVYTLDVDTRQIPQMINKLNEDLRKHIQKTLYSFQQSTHVGKFATQAEESAACKTAATNVGNACPGLETLGQGTATQQQSWNTTCSGRTRAVCCGDSFSGSCKFDGGKCIALDATMNQIGTTLCTDKCFQAFTDNYAGLKSCSTAEMGQLVPMLQLLCLKDGSTSCLNTMQQLDGQCYMPDCDVYSAAQMDKLCGKCMTTIVAQMKANAALFNTDQAEAIQMQGLLNTICLKSGNQYCTTILGVGQFDGTCTADQKKKQDVSFSDNSIMSAMQNGTQLSKYCSNSCFRGFVDQVYAQAVASSTGIDKAAAQKELDLMNANMKALCARSKNGYCMPQYYQFDSMSNDTGCAGKTQAQCTTPCYYNSKASTCSRLWNCSVVVNASNTLGCCIGNLASIMQLSDSVKDQGQAAEFRSQFDTCNQTIPSECPEGMTVTSVLTFQGDYANDVLKNQDKYAALVRSDLAVATGCIGCVKSVTFSTTNPSGQKMQVADSSTIYAKVTMAGYDDTMSTNLQQTVTANPNVLVATNTVATTNSKFSSSTSGSGSSNAAISGSASLWLLALCGFMAMMVQKH